MPRRRRALAVVSAKKVGERMEIYSDGRLVVTVKTGDKFRGSVIAPSGRFATCEHCGNRHAVGVRCVRCVKERERPKRKEHKDIQKPEVEGI